MTAALADVHMRDYLSGVRSVVSTNDPELLEILSLVIDDLDADILAAELMVVRAAQFVADTSDGSCQRCGVELGIGRNKVEAARGLSDVCKDCATWGYESMPNVEPDEAA